MVGEVASWLALSKAPALGPVRFRRLLNHYENPDSVFLAARNGEISPGQCPTQTLQYLRNPNWEAIEPELRWLDQPEHHIALLDQPEYPQLLREITDAPAVLYAVGQIHVANSLQLAMVGSRNPTPSGKEIAFQFAKTLAELGMTVTSGLALGIDAAAHRGAVATDQPTIAVLAHGLDCIYPACHKNLATEILAKGGLLVSEYGLGARPLRSSFPRRNRLISGMTIGTLVVEAGSRSGALITANHAAAQGREVFAVPGSINNPLARGCHRLIRQGAKLVETVEHIVEEFVGELAVNKPRTSANLNQQGQNKSECKEVLKFLGFDPVSVDLIVDRCGKTVDWVSSQLLELELQGLVTSLPGGKFVRLS